MISVSTGESIGSRSRSDPIPGGVWSPSGSCRLCPPPGGGEVEAGPQYRFDLPIPGNRVGGYRLGREEIAPRGSRIERRLDPLGPSGKPRQVLLRDGVFAGLVAQLQLQGQELAEQRKALGIRDGRQEVLNP